MPTYDNNIFGDLFNVFGTKWLNPAFYFNILLNIFNTVVSFVINNGSDLISLYHTILFFLALFFITLMAYCAVRMFEIRKKEHAHLHHEIVEYAHHQAEREKKKQSGETASKNDRWVKTLDYLFSPHSSDWKLAIVEADIMLEALMEQLGFKGESLGEKLKGASQDKFRNLTLAWEVHTIRNRIAHEGEAFQMSHHEAKRVVATYEQIFREFGYI